MAQCNRCIHSDVCKFSDTIQALKEQNPFIKDISCNYQLNGENTKTQKKPTSQTAAQQASKEEPENGAEPNGQDGIGNDPKAELKAMGLEHLNLSSRDFIMALNVKGVKTINDVYTYENNSGWASSGLPKDSLKELSGKLQAFNLPALRL